MLILELADLDFRVNERRKVISILPARLAGGSDASKVGYYFLAQKLGGKVNVVGAGINGNGAGLPIGLMPCLGNVMDVLRA